MVDLSVSRLNLEERRANLMKMVRFSRRNTVPRRKSISYWTPVGAPVRSMYCCGRSPEVK